MPIDLLPDLRTSINRRQALGAMALAASAAVAGCSRNVGSQGNASGWYALLSDPHIAADPSANLRGEVMFDNLRRVASEILHADDPPKGVLIDGDLAFQQGEAEDYATLLRALDPLRKQNLPIHLTLGNHDHRDHIRSVMAPTTSVASPVDRVVGSIDGPGIRFLLLDSQNGVNVTAGMLGDSQLQWLAGDLDANPLSSTVVCVHHNINAHSESALRDTAALMDVLRPRRQVKAVVFGHTHVWNVQKIDDIHMINLPAVGYRFLPKQPLGWVELRPHADGAELELRCIGGDRRQDQRRVELKWRSA